MHNIPKTEDLVTGLLAKLRDKLDDHHDWTAETFAAVSNLFPAHGTRHAARRRHGDGWSPEYLIDLCISDDVKGDTDDPFTYRQLLVAMECEWGPSCNALKYDFSKLADTRAVRKLFVGYLRSADAAGRFVREAAAFLEQHEQVGDEEDYGVLLFTSEALTPHGWIITKKGPATIRLS